MRSNVLTFYIQLRSLFGFTSGLNFCVHFCVQFLGSLFRVHLLYFPSPLHALYTEVLLVFSERGCVSLPDDTLTPMIKIEWRRKFTAWLKPTCKIHNPRPFLSLFPLLFFPLFFPPGLCWIGVGRWRGGNDDDGEKGRREKKERERKKKEKKKRKKKSERKKVLFKWGGKGKNVKERDFL